MREDTQKALAEYEVKTLGNKKHIEILDERISPDESVLYIAPANLKFKININSVKKTAAGAIAFTEQHIYIYNMATPDEEYKIPLWELVNVDFKAGGMTGATFTLLFIDATIIEFSSGYKKNLAVKLFETIKELILKNAESRPTLQEEAIEVKAEPQSQPDTADELRKFKQLLDDEIITQEEFDAKKKQLLGL